MPSTRRLYRGAGLLLLPCLAILLVLAGRSAAHHNLPHWPHDEPQKNHHPPPPPQEPPPPEPPPPEPPPPEPPPPKPPSTSAPNRTAPPAKPRVNRGGTVGASAEGSSNEPRQAVPYRLAASPEPTQKRAKPARRQKPVPTTRVTPPAPPPTPTATAPAESNPERSGFAETVLAPNELDAEHVAEGGVLALLLFALLYLPVKIFNKATQKNHETISGWFARPRAWWAAATGWIPLGGSPVAMLGAGVLISTALYMFVDPHFPGREGAVEWVIGMLLGFALVGLVFFGTWRYVVHRLEPECAGRWRIYPPYILLAAVLVMMARLAHFLPGVVLGTVAEYEPSRKPSTRTAGIRVLSTYGTLALLGLVAWFAWIPVTESAHEPGASSLILVLDAMLAVTFVVALETMAFGLIPITYLDGHYLYEWKRWVWLALWGGSLLWLAIVIVNPALGDYGHMSGATVIGLSLLFGSLMLVAVTTWGYFRVREARLAGAAAGPSDSAP